MAASRVAGVGSAEVASEVLTKASSYLLAEHGALLAELVRTVMAVEACRRRSISRRRVSTRIYPRRH